MDGLNRSKAEREERERLERIEREMLEAEIRAKALAEESLKRVIHLTQSGETLKKYDRVLMDFAGENQSLKEWKIFTECREVPEISSLSAVNSFLAGWVLDLQRDTSLEIVFRLSPNVLQLINEMTEFLELPADNFSIEMLHSMGKIYHDFRRKQQEFIDQSTYNVLIDLRELFDPELGVFESTQKTDQIVHSLWGNLYSCPEHRGHYYEELNFRFRIPDSLIMTRGIYRLLKTDYDHLSDTSNSYYQPGVSSFLREPKEEDLEKPIEKELPEPELRFCEELSGKEEQVTKKEDWGLVTSQVEEKKKLETMTMTRTEATTTRNKEEVIPERNGSQEKKTLLLQPGNDVEDASGTRTKASSCLESEMVHDVPGRQAEVGGETNEDIGESGLELRSKSPSDSLSKEETESEEKEGQEGTEMKKEPKDSTRTDSSKVRWEPELKVWSTDGFYDIRFNEDSLQMWFRTTKFGVLGLAHNRWSNLPYQSWELRPNGLNKATLTLMAAMAVIEFSIENDLICVGSIQNVSNSDVIEAAIVGKFVKHRQLVKALRYHGLDVFPQRDSYAYVDGILLKHIAAEDHLYQCMAVGASAFNFHWSRWNMLAGREKMVYQLRERHGTTTPGNYQMVLNTPKGATLINCTEVSPNYSEEPMENYEYRGDLIQLMETISTPEATEKIEQASGHFVETIRLLLNSIRPLTFS